MCLPARGWWDTGRDRGGEAQVHWTMWLLMMLGTLSFWVVITLGIVALFSAAPTSRDDQPGNSPRDGS